MKAFLACPLCKEDVASDANAINHCALCGMAIGEMDRRWCSGCEERFKTMLEA